MAKKNLMPAALMVVLAGALLVAACNDTPSPTAPPPPMESSTAVPGSASLVAGEPGSIPEAGVEPGVSGQPVPVLEANKGAASEFMLRARVEASGFLGQPLLGSAWVHVTGPPRSAEVTSFAVGPPGPGGLPIAQIYTFANGDWFRVEGLTLLDPPPSGGPPPPGVYGLIATLTIVGGAGDFAGMTGDLEVKKGVAVLEAVPGGLFERAEWHLKGRVQLGG